MDFSKFATIACLALAGCAAAERTDAQNRGILTGVPGCGLLSSAIVGCEAIVARQKAEAAARDAADDATCKGYGAMPGTEVYVQCRIGLAQVRATQGAAAGSAAAAAAASAAASEAPRPLNCTSLALGGGLTTTNCN